MKVCILMGSPKLHSNTAELCKPFMEELEALGQEIRYLTLADKKIGDCLGCYCCQDVSDCYGCVQKDDMYSIVDAIVWSDCVILATPIYTWYCTSIMKRVLDRHYGLNKFYGSAEGSLITGKKLAILATHGYDEENATTPFVIGMKHFCEHSKMEYLGIYSARDIDDLASFQTSEVMEGAREFARKLIDNMK